MYVALSQNKYSSSMVPFLFHLPIVFMDNLNALPVGAMLELTLDPTAAGVGDAIYAVSIGAAAGELTAT